MSRLLSRRQALQMGVALAGTMALAACGSPPAQTPVSSSAKLSLAKVSVLWTAQRETESVPDFAAFKRLGDRGVTVDVQDVTGADVAIKALVAGQGDLVMANVVSGIVAEGQKIKSVVPSAAAAYFTLVAPASFQKWSDFAGHSIGDTATTDASYWSTVMQLQKNNVDPKAVQWITVRGVTARIQALQAGKIDAGQVSVYGASQLLQNPRLKRFADVAKDFPDLMFNAYWARDSFIQDHADVLQAFAEAMMQAHRDAQDKATFMAEAKPVIANYIDDAALSSSYDILKDMNIWDPNESRWNAKSGGFTTKSLVDAGILEKDVPFSQWATTQFVDSARAKLGPYKPS